MTYYIISTRQRPSALNYSRELPSKATKPSNMAEPLGSSCSRRRRSRRGIGTRTRPHARTRADTRAARPSPPAARARTCCGRDRPRRWAPRRMSSGRGGRAGGRGAGRAPAFAGAHTPGTRAGRHSRTGAWLVMEEGLCESNSFLGHCCHRGEHFNPLPKRKGGHRRAEGGGSAGGPRRGGLRAPG